MNVIVIAIAFVAMLGMMRLAMPIATLDGGPSASSAASPPTVRAVHDSHRAGGVGVQNESLLTRSR
jgi:hypothetical protein